MTFDDVVALLRDLPDTDVTIAGADNGAPEVSWGAAFATYAPSSDDHAAFPFATVVIRDVPGFDEASRVSRPGVYRVNLAVGRALVAERAEHGAAADELDRWIPHPVYARQGWLSICSPSDRRRDELVALLGAAHERARERRPR